VGDAPDADGYGDAGSDTLAPGSPIGKLHFNLIDGTALSVGHHVIVSDDVALIRHNDARPK